MTTETRTIRMTDTVGEIVARRPALSRQFEEAGIDYCCGGKLPLEEACRKKGIGAAAFLAGLEAAAAKGAEEPVVDALAMTLSELAGHIEKTHHAYLRSELPRITALAEKVAAVHGGEDPRLVRVKETFLNFARKLIPHLKNEEDVLFPLARSLESKEGPPAEVDRGAIATLIRQMESEHEDVGVALAQLRELTDAYTPPAWACNTYRALLDALAHLERDMHRHVHKENSILFPKAIEQERQRAGKVDPS